MGVACDEEHDTCGAPGWCTEGRPDCALPGDCDGDGAPAFECNGNDCDDSDGRRYPGAEEVCDSSGLDEDCNEATLAGTDDGDRDHDGSTSIACCNSQSDGTLQCGGDCDDNDAARNPEAPDRCNGEDDNCDTIADNGFECAAGDTVEDGTLDACGRPGVRTCDALCSLSSAAYRAEDGSTCDYCADSMMGLAPELTFATSMADQELAFSGAIVGRMGGGSCGTRSCDPADPTSCQVEIVDHDGCWWGGLFSSEEGTETAPARVTVGYGNVTIQAEMSARFTSSPATPLPSGDWGIVAYLDLPSDPVGAAPPRLDVPGWVGVWRSSAGHDTAELTETDSLDPTQLGHSNAGPSVPSAGGWVSQQMTMTIHPDDPTTVADETEIILQHSCGGISACEGMITCRNSTSLSCGRTITPGEQLLVGVVGQSYSIDYWVQGTTIHRNAICP